MATVLTLGTFDLFHPGHLALLRECRKLSNQRFTSPMLPNVVVGLNTDEFVTRYKGQPPILRYPERKSLLTECRLVDSVISNPLGGSTPQYVGIRQVAPHVIAVGSDWEGRDYPAQLGVTQEWLDAEGIQVIYVPRPDPPLISSTVIRDRVVARSSFHDIPRLECP